MLRWYGLGMAAFCAQHILLRGFYSLKDTMTPMRISCWLVGLNIVLNLILVWYVREAAFGISTAITATLHVGISVWLLRQRLGGRMDMAAIAVSVIKTIVAATAASLAAWFTYRWTSGLDTASWNHTASAAFDVFGPLAAAILLFFIVGRLLGMQEIRWLLARSVGPSKGRETEA